MSKIEISRDLIADIDEVFDYFVRSGVGPCGCGEKEPCNRSHFAFDVEQRLTAFMKENRAGVYAKAKPTHCVEECPECYATATYIRTDKMISGAPVYGVRFTCTRCGWTRTETHGKKSNE